MSREEVAAVCSSSELTLSAAGEKGKGARGVPQIKEAGGAKKLT